MKMARQKKQSKKKAVRSKAKRSVSSRSKKFRPARLQKTRPKISPSGTTERAALNDRTLAQTVALVASHLEKAGHEPVLVGQACTSFYLGWRLPTRLIEFVVKNYNVTMINTLMKKLGYKETDFQIFDHKGNDHQVLLTPAPLIIGDEVTSRVHVVRSARGPIRILTPTDVVCQRLAVYYSWGDARTLEEAVALARVTLPQVDLHQVRRFSARDWAEAKFEVFLKTLGEG